MPSYHAVLAATSAAPPSSTSATGPTVVAASTHAAALVLPRSAHSSAAPQQRDFHFGSGPSRPAPGAHAHIASALVQHAPQAATQAFSAASLPRTSSLLPPPHIETAHSPDRYTPPSYRNPLNALPAAGFPADPVTDRGDPPPSWSRPSRSSSLGGIPPEAYQSLHRWSHSTASSRTSSPAHRRTPSLGRRMSVDAVALQTQTNTLPPVYQSPRKLQKSRPATATSGSPRPAATSRVRQHSPAPVPPLASLPPIVTLPSLEQEVQGGSQLLTGRDTPQRPVYLRSADTDDTDYLWDGTVAPPEDSVVAAEADRTQSPGGRLDTMQAERNGERLPPKGHTRNRSQNAKGSADSSKSRDKGSRPPSQKAMLSRALQKANAAVQLDNATNIDGARDAYAEACDLLHQVLLRTTGDEDRKKLEAIVSSGTLIWCRLAWRIAYMEQRKTYTTRIAELDRIGPIKSRNNRPLPRPPEGRLSDESQAPRPNGAAADEEPVVANAVVANAPKVADDEPRTVPSYSIPRVQTAFTPGPPNIPTYDTPSSASEQYTLQSSFSKGPRRDLNVNGLALQPAAEAQYAPPPLSPRRPPSPAKVPVESPVENPMRTEFVMQPTRLAPEPAVKGHTRGNSHESISWLDPIDESGGSAASSIHSRSSSMRVRRKHIRAASGDTEAEFDAALDDAIEAAYDDGYDGMDEPGMPGFDDDGEAAVAKAMRKVELAKERVRESEREALALASERERRLREQLEQQELEEQEEYGNREVFFDGNDSDEEEERMLEEMTKGYAIEDFTFGPLRSKSIPRASDSSEFTNRTWHSSMASNPPTATTVMTTLSTVSENTIMPGVSKGGAANFMPPPPMQALPDLPQTTRAVPETRALPEQSPTKDSVRNRRLSGQNPKELKIETTKLPSRTSTPTGQPAAAAATATGQTKTGGYIAQQRQQALSAGPSRAASSLSRRLPSPAPVPSPAEAAPPTPPLPPGVLQEAEGRSGSPSVPRPGLRKNFSSSSLKSMRSRNMSVTNLDDASDASPGTPLNPQFGANRLPAMPSLPTPVATAFKERMAAGGGTGGLYLFDNDFHSPHSPGTPNLQALDSPVALEACPTDFLLRPFWLMRCLYQTLAHARGGYISNRLFVPRDVWKVKGVKLKNIDEKISNCDLLTAALMKLSKVDTCDADAVLVEMQSLESVLDQAQAALSRKLGNDVGMQGANSMFKDASAGESDPNGNVPRSTSVSGKSSSFSWRRLRSKNSSAGLSNGYASGGRKESIAESTKEGLTMASLPMTSHPTTRPPKRDVMTLQFSGPNANYMAALARLFDAAQAVGELSRPSVRKDETNVIPQMK